MRGEFLLLKVNVNAKGGGIGEVRARVKLTNTLDEMLLRRGRITASEVRVYEADALVDTGAVRTVLPSHVVEKLGLAIRGQRVPEYADGRKDSVGITEPVTVDWQGRDVIEDALVLGDEVILGQTAIEKMDVLVDCTNGTLVPNPAHPDQPVTKVKWMSVSVSH